MVNWARKVDYYDQITGHERLPCPKCKQLTLYVRGVCGKGRHRMVKLKGNPKIIIFKESAFFAWKNDGPFSHHCEHPVEKGEPVCIVWMEEPELNGFTYCKSCAVRLGLIW